MQKWKISVLAAVLIAACLAQNASQLESAEVNRVASRLACTCGCNLKMDCKMEPWPCHICKGFKSKIIEMQAAGKTDDQILDQFVQENGKSILAIGPGPLGMIGPYAALGLGALLVVFIIRRYAMRRPQEAPADTAVLDQYHDRIEKDLAKLD